MADFDQGRPILQAILNDPSLQAILGDEASTLLANHQPNNSTTSNNQSGAAATSADLFHLTAGEHYDGHDEVGNAAYEQLAFEQNEATLDDITLRHRCSDLEAENARLRTFLQQQSASTTELTRKLNLRDVVVDGLRKSVIQSQSQNARALGQPATLGFDVVEALEEELATAVAAQVRLREASEAALKTKLDRQERGLRRIIAAKEREIIQLHLQFRQTLIQLRSQHTGDIQNVFEENTKLKRMAAEAEQNALIAAEVQFNTRLRAEQMRIESECERKIGAKLVEMKYLRECLDTQEAAAKKLEDTIAELNGKIEAKERVLNHVLDVEMPYEVNKIKKQLEEYVTKDSAQGQLDLANALVEIESLKTDLEEAKETTNNALRDKDDAVHSMSSLKNDNTQKDKEIRDYQSRLNLLQQTISALERDQEQTAMELHLMRRMQLQQEDQQNASGNNFGNQTLGNTMGGSPTSTSASAEAELRRQVALYEDENGVLKADMTKALEQVTKYREDVKSAAQSRSVLQERCQELEDELEKQQKDYEEKLAQLEKKLQKELGGGGRSTRVNIVLPSAGEDDGSVTPGSLQRRGSLRRTGSGKNLTASAASSTGGSFRRPGSASTGNKNNTGKSSTLNKDNNNSSGETGTLTPSVSGETTPQTLTDTSTKPTANNNNSLESSFHNQHHHHDSKNNNDVGASSSTNNHDNDDVFEKFGASWEKSQAAFDPTSSSSATPRKTDHHPSSASTTDFTPKRDPTLFTEVRHVGIQCARLLPPPSTTANNQQLRPGSASLSGRRSGTPGIQGIMNNSSASREVSFIDKDINNTNSSSNNNSGNLDGDQQQQKRPTSANISGRPTSAMGVNRVDSLIGNTHNNIPHLVQSQPPSAVSHTLNPQDSQHYHRQQQQQDTERDSSSGVTSSENKNIEDIPSVEKDSNNNRPTSGQSTTSTSSNRDAGAKNNTNIKNTGGDGTNNNTNNNNLEVEILPDEELHEYGVHSTVDDRLINARLRIELAQIRFEVQHLAPPRFMAQAKAMINSWEPIEEIEVPLAEELTPQNDNFEDELAKRREFHAVLFPANMRCARFPYRSDPSAAGPTDGMIDKSQLSLLGDDGISKRSKNSNKDFLSGGDGEQEQPFQIDSQYDVRRGDLDALRREFIASAMALSQTPGGMDVLRVPISSVFLRPHSASKRIADGTGNNELLQFIQNTTVGAGFRTNSAPASPSRNNNNKKRPLSAVSLNNNNNATVRTSWKPPEGFLNVDTVQIPSVDHFTTRSQVLQPHRPPGDRSLHWKEAASSHTGTEAKTARPAIPVRRVPVNVNLDVTAVLADKTFAQEQKQIQESEASATTLSKKHSEFSNVMRQRMDPSYQNGTDFAAKRPASSSRPTSARLPSTSNNNNNNQPAATSFASSLMKVGGKNGRTLQ